MEVPKDVWAPVAFEALKWIKKDDSGCVSLQNEDIKV